ncbi:hypothetical protein L917_14800 [Phytophthora nicotianae]|uniref:Uncharacterized protein n=1 Tax=Phytophthora nicotianae TaxID=4792 RepID=W2IEG9_PHYNI|nr:hypothetical protein L915_15090 [Phytophthora nicotianae]ETL32455.1 hypothetical protein L916_14982 [Phytophthora nicotianae]ETL85707.1 hypothetical protein L917_14800 [Phytophthora nicotianae]
MLSKRARRARLSGDALQDRREQESVCFQERRAVLSQEDRECEVNTTYRVSHRVLLNESNCSVLRSGAFGVRTRS